MVRASACHAEGRRFESGRPRIILAWTILKTKAVPTVLSFLFSPQNQKLTAGLTLTIPLLGWIRNKFQYFISVSISIISAANNLSQSLGWFFQKRRKF